MGAAGITCSTSEMSAKGEHGMIIWLDKVPTRQNNMQAFEILLSESQERMLIVVKKGQEATVEAIFEKWDLNCAVIGEVTDTKRLHYYMNGELVADVPAIDLVLGGGAPVYKREWKEPAYFAESKKFDISHIPEPGNLKEIAHFLAAHPNLCSKRFVYEQYDSMVGTVNMSTNKPSDAAIVNLKNTDSALALTVDCNSRYVNADPETGCAIAVSEAARNITCSGGTPLAITNCLNFGNPYNPEVYWQFVGSIKGMSAACKRFDTPVTGGNVSFYNQSSYEGPVFPTPTIGMLGLLDNKKTQTTLDFKSEGDLIYVIGKQVNDIASSEYLYSWHKVKLSPAPYFNLEEEYSTQKAIASLIQKGLLVSAHDCSDGGLFLSLLESAMVNNLGFDIQSKTDLRKDAFLFGEAQGRILVSVKAENASALEQEVSNLDIPYFKAGKITSSPELLVDGDSLGTLADFTTPYQNTLGAIMKG
jgi:phosphoribosylformylglycinamidine synthase